MRTNKKDSKIRLCKALASAGVASRRHVEKLIFAGQVKVNNVVAWEPQTLVSWSDKIVCQGKAVRRPEEKVYYVMNKPSGYLCSHKRIFKSKLIYDLVEDKSHRVFSVGRLDRETTGLLLLTNDGEFAQKVIHPSSNISKEYLVKVANEITHEDLVCISEGVEIDNRIIQPKKVKKVRKGTLKITVMEGKKHEVRELVKKANLRLLSLCRIRIGGLTLNDLPLGACVPLSEKHRRTIFS